MDATFEFPRPRLVTEQVIFIPFWFSESDFTNEGYQGRKTVCSSDYLIPDFKKMSLGEFVNIIEKLI
jgi:hypothetical protein